ncbi:MAG: isocitrate/isopropylmalate dehydrogenase family protein [Promethearchaeota archaeon]
MPKKKIAVTPGDGIGLEVVPEGVKVLKLIAEYTDFEFEFEDAPIGGNIWKKMGTSLPESSYKIMQNSDAILFGAVGLPDLPQGVAEIAILKIRQGFNQYVNLRPVKLFEPLRDKCPLKEEYIGKGIDITTIRENTEGLYSKIGGIIHQDAAVDNMVFTKTGVERIQRFAFEYAKMHKHTKLTSVDKANILSTSQFWRNNIIEMSKEYPEIKLEHFYIDAFCQWLIRKPYEIETVVTSNMFGDIASDEAAYLIGSLGMAASGNINPDGISMYEPIHGSAPDIAGQGIANPIGTILSVKLMMEQSFKSPEIANMIEHAVEQALYSGRTPDIMPVKEDAKLKKLTTIEMGDLIRDELKKILKK